MTYGVDCKTCGAFIEVAKDVAIIDDSALHWVVPLEPIACPECGSSHTYGSEDAKQKT
ncbi:MAG TPA: hypothetical protein VE778_04410 [Candidatus Bathyarchaeia archaeon]|jgi:hypothetical protein|nr:hypothetical protein [Candidatus Bathyarchaeia archaeon]